MSIPFPYTGAKSTVVVIDSGWSPAWSTGRLVYEHDYVGNDSDARSADTNTHGAMVTSSILDGAPDVGIIALKVLPDGGGATDSTVVEKALQWVVANADAYDIAAVNLSVAAGNTDKPLALEFSDELAALAAKRVLTVVAGGNAGQGDASQGVSLFAADPNSITVSATTGDGAFPAWAQRSPTQTDISADGTDIAMTDLAGQTFLGNGSSFATPAVTSAIVLAQEAARDLRGSALTQEEFLELARSTGTPVGDTGYMELDTDALLAKLVATYDTPAVAAPADTDPVPAPTPVPAPVVVADGDGAPNGCKAKFAKSGLGLGQLKTLDPDALIKRLADGPLPKALAKVQERMEDGELPALLEALSRTGSKHWGEGVDTAAWTDAVTDVVHDMAAGTQAPNDGGFLDAWMS